MEHRLAILYATEPLTAQLVSGEDGWARAQLMLNCLEAHWLVDIAHSSVYYPARNLIIPLVTAPDQTIASGRHWYLLGDTHMVYGGYEQTDWPIVIDLSEHTANINLTLS